MSIRWERGSIQQEPFIGKGVRGGTPCWLQHLHVRRRHLDLPSAKVGSGRKRGALAAAGGADGDMRRDGACVRLAQAQRLLQHVLFLAGVEEQQERRRQCLRRCPWRRRRRRRTTAVGH